MAGAGIYQDFMGSAAVVPGNGKNKEKNTLLDRDNNAYVNDLYYYNGGSGVAPRNSLRAVIGPGVVNTMRNDNTTGTGLILEGTVTTPISGALVLKAIRAGSNVTVTNNTNDVTIAATSGVTIANEGAGAGQVYDTVNSTPTNALLKTIAAGAGITVTNNATDITLAASGVNTVANEGAGAGTVYDTVNSTATAAVLKTIAAGAGITVTNNATNITLAASGVNTIANEGAGTGTVYDTVNSTATAAVLKTIAAGTNVSIANNATDITISAAIGGVYGDIYAGAGFVLATATSYDINVWAAATVGGITTAATGYTVITTGVYWIFYSIAFTGAAGGGKVTCNLLVNGSTTALGGSYFPNPGAGVDGSGVSFDMQSLTAGDTVNLRVFQDSGNNITFAGFGTEISIFRIG